MAFRVLIAGGRHFTDYPLLRDTLDALLANRPPDVRPVTAGGPGVPMLAASYAAERGFCVAALVPDFGRHHAVAAVGRRDAELVAQAEAALIVWDDRNPAARGLRSLVEARGIPVHVIGGDTPRAKVQRTAPPDQEARRGLPD